LTEIIRRIDDPAASADIKQIPSSESLNVLDMASGLRVVFRTNESGRVVELVDLDRPGAWSGLAPRAAAPRASS